MAIVNKFNVNKQEVTLDADIIENMSANDVSYNDSTQYDEDTVGDKLSELEKEVIYDVSAHNNGVTFASLSALLSDENLSTLIPTSVRHGGMSICFIQSSDNKYVQFRLMANSWSDVVSDWQGVDDKLTPRSDNLVTSGAVANALYMVHNQYINEKEEKILIEDNQEHVIHELTSEYANFKNLKSNGNNVLTINNITEEVIHQDYDEEIEIKGIESYPYVKIGQYGIKAKGYYDIEGNLFRVLQEKDYNDARYNLRFANSLLLEARKNPFELSPLDDGYISFVFDDLCSDIDKVAAIFAEYNFPICIAAIPSRFNNICNGLSEDSQGYTVGMTTKEVCERVVEFGGEIMAHNGPYITIDNENDFEFMFNHFVTTKRVLEDNGFIIRGLIRAGGCPSDKSPHMHILNQWLIGNYEYSNLGSVSPYNQERGINLDSNDLSQLKTSALSLKQNHKWTGVMAHQLNTGGDSFITESNLRELLSYISEIGLQVVTYAHINDSFHSSKFLNSLNI